MSFGRGLIVGHLVTLRRFVRTFLVGHGRTWTRRGGGHQRVDLLVRARSAATSPSSPRTRGPRGCSRSNTPTSGCRSIERGRVLPVLIYDSDDGHIRCVSCNICAKVCPPQCIWIKQAKKPDGKPIPQPSDFYVDMDVCMNCGLCAEYCPFDAIKMDHHFELANHERHQSHVFTMQDLLVSSDYYAQTHPEAYADADEVGRAGQGGQEEGPAARQGAAAARGGAPLP